MGESAITGSLKNVTGYTGFSSEPSEQKGHYLALKFDVTPADATTTVELVGGTKGPVALDEDKNIVLLIKNNSQSVKVISTKDSSSVTKIYSSETFLPSRVAEGLSGATATATSFANSLMTSSGRGSRGSVSSVP